MDQQWLFLSDMSPWLWHSQHFHFPSRWLWALGCLLLYSAGSQGSQRWHCEIQEPAGFWQKLLERQKQWVNGQTTLVFENYYFHHVSLCLKENNKFHVPNAKENNKSLDAGILSFLTTQGHGELVSSEGGCPLPGPLTPRLYTAGFLCLYLSL